MSLGSSLETVSKPGSAVPEVFGLTLSDGLIEEMIKCVQIGKPVQLSLGEQPVSFQTIVAISTGDFWCCYLIVLVLTMASLPIEVDAIP